jgi:2'-5' RNA ligase
VVPAQAHYTLRFLGEQPPERRDAAARAAAVAARAGAPFAMTAETLGVFSDERHAHTLWVGAGEGKSELAALAALLDGALGAEGFSREDRAFSAHMTLARVKKRLSSAVVRSLLAVPCKPLGPMRVEQFILFESRSGPNGAVYAPLDAFRL